MERHGIIAVPLTVVLGDRALEEGTEISARSLAQALQKRRPVTTSRPSPEIFADDLPRRRPRPAPTGIVSLHLSSEISGTYDAAVLAAEDAPVPVRVVDTGMVAMALGFCALAAAEAAEGGGTLDEAVAAAEKRAAGTSAYFYVDTLDYLRRGGRIGAAQALLGSALAVKPLLQLDGGRIELLEKVRTASKAIARLEEIVAERAGASPVDIAVHHLAAPERAAALADRLRERVPGLVELHVSEVGAVIGAHTGPGLLGRLCLASVRCRGTPESVGDGVIHNWAGCPGNWARSLGGFAQMCLPSRGMALRSAFHDSDVGRRSRRAAGPVPPAGASGTWPRRRRVRRALSARRRPRRRGCGRRRRSPAGPGCAAGLRPRAESSRLVRRVRRGLAGAVCSGRGRLFHGGWRRASFGVLLRCARRADADADAGATACSGRRAAAPGQSRRSGTTGGARPRDASWRERVGLAVRERLPLWMQTQVRARGRTLVALAVVLVAAAGFAVHALLDGAAPDGQRPEVVRTRRGAVSSKPRPAPGR